MNGIYASKRVITNPALAASNAKEERNIKSRSSFFVGGASGTQTLLYEQNNKIHRDQLKPLQSNNSKAVHHTTLLAQPVHTKSHFGYKFLHKRIGYHLSSLALKHACFSSVITAVRRNFHVCIHTPYHTILLAQIFPTGQQIIFMHNRHSRDTPKEVSLASRFTSRRESSVLKVFWIPDQVGYDEI